MIAASKAQLIRSVCRESYADFFKTFWHEVSAEELVWNWHIQLMCDEIQAVCERIFAGKDKDYDPIFNVPPGTSKSTTCSVLLPAWCWTRMPSFAFLGASHGLELALDLSRKTRDCVRSELYRSCFPNLMIREDQDTKGKFMTTAGGVRQAIGSGGSIIGVHFDLIVIDDPIDPQKVVSEAELAEVNLWIEQTLSQRKKSHRRSVTMMVMQRLHQNDPSARMAERGESRVRHFVIPATLEYKVNPPELARRYRDGLMDPVRLPKAVLDEKRGELGEYGFAGQYGQDPKPAGGGLFKTDLIGWGDERRPMKQVVRFWDKAACLVKGTMVETHRGPRPIEYVRAGDRVLTRSGYRKVVWSGVSKEVKSTVSVGFANGVEIEGTEDHPVWTENRGWVWLANLNGGDRVVTLSEGRNQCRGVGAKSNRARRSLCSSESGTRGGRGSGTSKRWSKGETASGGRTPSTGPSGNTTTVTSPAATTFITRTETGTTTRSITWNASPAGNTSAVIPTGVSPTTNSPTSPRPVEFTGSGSTTPGTSVSGVAGGSTLAGIERPDSVPPAAGGSLTVPVYDLQVEGTHEFFANGILVHNTDSANPRARKAAWTVGVRMEEDLDGFFWVTDVVRVRVDTFARERLIKRTALRDTHKVLIGIEQEGASGGVDSAKVSVRKLAGFRVIVAKARQNKEARAYEFSVIVNQGLLKLPDRMRKDGHWVGWAKDFIDELSYWPFSTFRDQGDAASGAFNLTLTSQLRPGAIGSRKNRGGAGKRPTSLVLGRRRL